jgi:hypothetical protein
MKLPAIRGSPAKRNRSGENYRRKRPSHRLQQRERERALVREHVVRSWVESLGMLELAQRPVRLPGVGKAADRMPLPRNKVRLPRSNNNEPSQRRAPPACRRDIFSGCPTCVQQMRVTRAGMEYKTKGFWY